MPSGVKLEKSAGARKVLVPNPPPATANFGRRHPDEFALHELTLLWHGQLMQGGRRLTGKCVVLPRSPSG
jgi:hypothetical protein